MSEYPASPWTVFSSVILKRFINKNSFNLTLRGITFQGTIHSAHRIKQAGLLEVLI